MSGGGYWPVSFWNAPLFKCSLGSSATLQNLFPYLRKGGLKKLLKAISELIMYHKHKMPSVFCSCISSCSPKHQLADSVAFETSKCWQYIKNTLPFVKKCLRHTWSVCKHTWMYSHSESRTVLRMSGALRARWRTVAHLWEGGSGPWVWRAPGKTGCTPIPRFSCLVFRFALSYLTSSFSCSWVSLFLHFISNFK